MPHASIFYHSTAYVDRWLLIASTDVDRNLRTLKVIWIVPRLYQNKRVKVRVMMILLVH
jgi:hypothetical protein